MPLDPINPVGPRRGVLPDPIPAVRAVESSTEKRRREQEQRRRRREVLPDLPPPPDDGRPHIDVRV